MEHLESKSGRVDDTYFTATDVEPDIITREDGTQFVQFYGGRGRSRSWGAPGCDNYILIDEPDFLFSLTGFYHKHRGGQFYRYFVRNLQTGKIERKLWSQLTLEQQQDCLDIWSKKAPGWSHCPGVLKTQVARPISQVERENGIGWKSLIITSDESGKIVRVQSPLKASDWTLDENEQWVIAADAEPSAENTNGIYIAFNAPNARGYRGSLCKVMLSGTIVIGESGARGQFARILEVK